MEGCYTADAKILVLPSSSLTEVSALPLSHYNERETSAFNLAVRQYIQEAFSYLSCVALF